MAAAAAPGLAVVDAEAVVEGPLTQAAAEVKELPELACKPLRPAVADDAADASMGAGHEACCAAAASWQQPAPQQTNTLSPQPQQQSRQQQQQVQQQQQQQSHGSGAAAGDVVLAGRRFESLLDVRFQMRALQRELLGDAEEVVVPRESPHFELIEAVFNLHPNRAAKARGAVRSFFVCRNPHVLGGRGCEFQFEDAEGRRDDFSLLKCTRPLKLLSKHAQLVEACAAAVADQIAEVAAAAEADPAQRSAAGGLRCSKCGLDFKTTVSYSGRTLSKLVQEYRERKASGRAPSRFGKRDPATGQTRLLLQSEADKAWMRGWVDFHRRNAKLAPLCKCCQGAAADARRAWKLRRHPDARRAARSGSARQ